MNELVRLQLCMYYNVSHMSLPKIYVLVCHRASQCVLVRHSVSQEFVTWCFWVCHCLKHCLCLHLNQYLCHYDIPCACLTYEPHVPFRIQMWMCAHALFTSLSIFVLKTLPVLICQASWKNITHTRNTQMY